MQEKVERYLQNAKKWKEELSLLRDLVSSSKLEETFKWGHPCYTLKGANVVLIHGFKEYCALLFFKGALMKDPDSVLVQQTDNVQSARQMRFTTVAHIKKSSGQIKAMLKEAMAVETSGLKVNFKHTSEFTMPEEFKALVDQDPALKKAFGALTPGRQRAYLLFFSAAKQESTRIARILKYRPAILKGKGLND